MVSNASGISASNKTGFHAGVFLDLGSKLIASVQRSCIAAGYNILPDSTKETGSVRHNYIALAQFNDH